MGIGPISASRKLMDRLALTIDDFEAIELNEAFASQSLAVIRGRGLASEAEHVNPNGGASPSVICWGCRAGASP
jgi:3-oxoadipyl-CoA thiolase